MTDERTIDGVAPDRWARPKTPGELADLLRETHLTDGWVLPVGGGAAQMAANPVDEIPVAVDTTDLSGIGEYEPTDLTISVGAGTRWSDLQGVLGENGQAIPVDVPFPDLATVGGVVATGYAGPRRLRDGNLKDLLLGASFVRGDGLVAKAGGMVVKNVSGFEIPRLLHGSWGSLAVISSVNLKVIPRAEFEMTLFADESDALEAAQRTLDLTTARSAIAAATVDGTLDRASVSVRLTGREQPTRDLAAELRASGGWPWRDDVAEGDASSAWWQERENRLAAVEGDRVSLDIGCQPSAVAGLLRTLRQVLPGGSSIGIHVSPGIGAVRLEFDANMLSLDAWARIWSEHGLDGWARVAIASAPRAWRGKRDVWFIPGAQRALMAALKGAFDPHDTLNRGRLWTAPLVPQT